MDLQKYKNAQNNLETFFSTKQSFLMTKGAYDAKQYKRIFGYYMGCDSNPYFSC